MIRQQKIDEYIEKSNDAFFKTAPLIESILSQKNRAFEAIVAEQEFTHPKDEVAFRKRLFQRTIINHLKPWLVAWARFFLPEHLHAECSRVHYEFAYDLTNMGLKRIAYAATRGIGKSTWTSLIHAIYVIVNEIEHNIVLVSANSTSVKKIVANVKTELKNNKRLLEFYGDRANPRKWTDDEFIWGNTLLTGYGIGSPLRVSKFKQYRITLAIIDDIETRAVFSLIQNKDPDEWLRMKDYIYREIDPAMEPDGRIHFIGTIFHPEAILPYMMKSRNYRNEVWSAIYEDENGKEHSIFPERFPLKMFYDKRDELIEQGQAETWYSEYMNKPNSTENKMFGRVARYQDEELRDKFHRLTFYQGFDLATGHGKDKTASIIIGRDTAEEGNVYVIDTFNKKIEIDEGTQEIITQASRYPLMSSHSQRDLMLLTNEKHLRAESLRRNIHFPLITDNTHQASGIDMGNTKVSKVKKEVRLSYLTPFMKSGKLKVSPTMTELIDQIENYPFVRFDDLLDALYEAVFNSNASNQKQKTPEELEEEEKEKIWQALCERLGMGKKRTDDEWGKWNSLD